MKEYKNLAFVVIDSSGAISKVRFDKEEGELPNFVIGGDPKLLLKRWMMVSQHIEKYLKEQIK